MSANLGNAGELLDRFTRLTEALENPMSEEESAQMSSLIRSVADVLSEERTKRSSAESLLAALEVKCRSLTDKIKDLTAKESTLIEPELKQPADESNLSKPELQFAQEKTELLQLLKRKDAEMQAISQENDRLNEKIKSIWKDSQQVEEELASTKTKFNLSIIQQSSLQNEIGRLEGSLKEREEELAFVQNAFNDYRKQKTKYIVDLEGKVELLEESSQTASNQLIQCKQRVAQMEENAVETQRTIHNLKLSLLEQEESFKAELSSQIRLVEVYKKNGDDMNEKLSKLEELHAKTERFLEDKENAFKIQLDNLTNENSKLSARIRERDDELQKIKTHIEADFVASISPTASAFEHVSKSGKSFSQIYTEYLQLQQDFLREKHERETLKDCLDEMLKDIEANAPLMEGNKRELQNTKNELASLLVQLNETKEKSEQLSKQNDSLLSKIRQLEDDCAIKDQQLEDLSRQVQVLLVEVEESTSEQLESNPISERLVDVKNIADLQEKNQNLLKIVRQLSGQVDELKQKKTSESTHSEIIQAKLEETLREVENLRENRKRQSEMINDYLSKTEQQENIQNQSHQCHVQLIFDDFKRETNLTINQLNEQIDGMRKENSTLRIESFRISSQIDILSEKNTQLTQKYAQSIQENSKLQNRNDQLNNSSLELQQKVVQGNDNLLLMKNELLSVQGKLSLLQAEISVSKSQVKKLESENSIISTEKERLSQLLANLQIFQSSLESGQSEGKTKMMNQLEEVEKELSSVRGKLTHELEYSKSLLHNFEREKSDYIRRLQELSESKTASFNELLVLKTKNEELNQQLEFLNKQLSSSEKRLSLLLIKQPDNNGEEAMDNELMRLRNTIARMHDEIKLANSHVEEFKLLANSNEKALNETTLFANELQSKLDTFEERKQQEITAISSQLNESQDRIIELEKEIVKLQQARAEILKESEVNREKISKYDSLKEQLDMRQNEYDELIKSLREDVRDEHEKYEKEVLSHAKDIQAFSQLKEHVELITDKLRQATLLNEQLKQESQSLAHQSDLQRERLEKALKDTEFKITDLSRQNDMLLNQIEALSKSNSPVISGTSFEMDEVVKFLRREKEILTCQNDILVQENKRLTQKVSQLSDEMLSIKNALEQEKASREVDSAMRKEYQALSEKIENANILKESNVTLRAECESMRQKHSALLAKLEATNSKYEPVLENNKQLESQIQALQQEIQELSRDNAVWKSRLDQIISRTDIIEMSKFTELSDNFEALQQKLKDSESKANDVQMNYSELNERYVTLENRSKKLAQICQSLKAKLSEQNIVERDDGEVAELKEQISSLQNENSKLDEKNKKLAAFVQKTADLKNALSAKMEQEIANNQVEWEKKLADMKSEHDLRISLLNSQWKAKLAKATAGTEGQVGNVPSDTTKFSQQEEKIVSPLGQFEEPLLKIEPEEIIKPKKHHPEEFPTELEPTPKRNLLNEISEEEESEQEEEESFDEEDENYEEPEEQLLPPSDAEELELEPEELSDKEEQEPFEEELKVAEMPAQREFKKTIILAPPVTEQSAKEPPASSRVIRTSIQRIPTVSASSVTSTSPVSNAMPSRINKAIKSTGKHLSSGQIASASGTKGARSGRGLKRGSKRPSHQS